MNEAHIPTLFARSETFDPEERYEDEEKDTLPCEPPQEDEEECPESDRRPIEYPYFQRQYDE